MSHRIAGTKFGVRRQGVSLLGSYFVLLTSRLSAILASCAVFGGSAAASPPELRTIHIDMTVGTSRAPDPVTVPSGTPVMISVLKNPFQTCISDAKTEQMKPEPDPLAGILTVAVSILNFVGEARDCPGSVDAPATIPDGRAIDAQLGRVTLELDDALRTLRVLREDYRDLAIDLQSLGRCEHTSDCMSDESAARAARKLAQRIRVTLDRPAQIPATIGTEIDLVSKAIVAKYMQIYDRDSGEGRWLTDAARRLACIQGKADIAIEGRKSADVVRDALAAINNQLEVLSTNTTMNIPIHAARNVVTTVTVSCVNSITRQPVVYVPRVDPGADVRRIEAHVVAPVTTVVSFRDRARAAVSAGVLISTLGKRQLAAQAVRTGTDSNGAITFTTRIREVDISDTQLVPFSFFNVVLAGTERASLNATAGVGLNANNGAKQVEYFVGPSMRIKDVFLQVGAHVGRRQELTNGFSVDDVMPDKYPGVPLARAWRTKLAMGVTYKIPLLK